MTARQVAVVGGGLAGITAALRMADAGHSVTIFEARPRLGGLTYSFRRGDLSIDNGQHVFLRCCTAYQALLRRLGVSDLATLQPQLDIPVRSIGRARATHLRRNNLPAPLHLSSSLMRYAPLRRWERVRFIRAALTMRRLDINDEAIDRRNFGQWLSEHGQTEHAIDGLWDLVGRATLNVTASQASLAQAAMVFQVGLLTEKGAADIGWSRVPLGQLHGESAAAALTAAAATVRTNAKVESIAQAETANGPHPSTSRSAPWIITAGGEQHLADQVVIAVPPGPAEHLLPAGSLPFAAGWSRELGTSPIVNVHIVFDRHVLDEEFVAGVGTPIQWVFDRTVPSGLDDGQYLAVSLSAADDIVDLPVAQIREKIMAALEALLPDARQAEVRDFFVTREREATFRASPGTAALRPGPVTSHQGLVVAGAWTATGWPATMEGAVRSGDAAAAAVLGQPVLEEVAA
jgi:squalene-associated FAD-dependent desaturase